MSEKGSKSSTSKNSLKVKALLEFTIDEKTHKPKKLYSITLEAVNKQGIECIEGLMNGKIQGLEYCQAKSIKAIAGGGGVYVLRLGS